MAPTSKDKRPTFNLASHMEFALTFSIRNIKEIIASKSQKFEVDARNPDGKTSLMFACGRGDKEMIKFLLDQGADPDAQCDIGNTAMHYAISTVGLYCPCLMRDTCRYQNHSRSEPYDTQTTLDVLRLLISRGASLKSNDSGLNPACCAALDGRYKIVEFFLERSTRSLKLSDAEKVRALQTLGVVSALGSRYTYQRDQIIASYEHFYKARIILERAEGASEESSKSGIASAFSLFSEKELSSEELKGIQNDDWAIRNQAFLIAERILPEDMKEDYLIPRLLTHARIGIFQFGDIEDRRRLGIEILKESLELELTQDLELSTVLRNIIHGFHMESWQTLQLHDCVKECFPLMDSCLQVLDGALVFLVHKVHKKVLCNLGTLLFKLALVECDKTTEIFESLLKFGEQAVTAIRRKCDGLRVTSITHFILHRGFELHSCTKRSEKLNRMRRLISQLVQCEDASHCNARGESMLHSLMLNGRLADQQFLKDVAQILIRNGCDVRVVDDMGMTVEEMLRCRPLESDSEELLEIVSSSAVLRLEEMAIRAILHHKIPHEGVLPRHLSAIVRGEPDTELQSDAEPSGNISVKPEPATEVQSDVGPPGLFRGEHVPTTECHEDAEPSSPSRSRELDPESDVDGSSLEEPSSEVGSDDLSDTCNPYSSYETDTDFSEFSDPDPPFLPAEMFSFLLSGAFSPTL